MGTPRRQSHRVIADLDVPVAMRDGVTLRANVYRPAGDAVWPTLLMRTPYGKDGPIQTSWPGLDPVQTAGKGFVVVLQDARGRFASDGLWEPFRCDEADGYDSVHWAARLPCSNGRVGMYGGSYDGSMQWLAAMQRPPSLAAIAPLMTWSEPMDGVFARGGATELGFALMWALLMGPEILRRQHADGDLKRRLEAVMDEWDHLDEKGYWELPVSDFPIGQRHGIRDVGAIRVLDDPGLAHSSRVRHHDVEVPSFHTGGWYDLFVQGTIDNHEAMVALGRESRLVIGPWSHPHFGDPIGERVFGLRGGRDAPAMHHGRDWADLQLAWFSRQLDGGSPDDLGDPPVRIFVMGRNEWRDESSWPLTRARNERWFLRPAGGLGTTPAVGEHATEFAYDPGDPVPTMGGHTRMSSGHVPGPFDQTPIERRQDVLVFSSAPLRHDLEVTGRVRVVLRVESSAPSTDWVARLCDVHPDGRSMNICDGIVRVCSRAGAPGIHEIDLWSTSNVFLRGHCIRLHVTSSSFPRWDRNLNTGDQHAPRHVIARQRVHHDADRPSYVELPVIPST
jgi:uncharacterized protein